MSQKKPEEITRTLKVKEGNFMNFEVSNPRTCSFKNPYYIEDPQYKKAYRRMAMKAAFPAGFGNGLFHIVLGVWVCLVGCFALLASANPSYAVLFIVVGVVVATVVAYLYGKYLQIKALFPRGAGMTGVKGHTPVVFWLVLVVIMVGFPIYSAYVNGYVAPQTLIGAFFGLLATLSYAKTYRNGLLLLAALCLTLPSGLNYIGMYTNATTLGVFLLTAPYEGILFVFCGIFLMNGSMIPGQKKHDRGRLRTYLTSGDPKKQFTAAAFLCNSIDPVLMPELLRLCQSSDYTVAYTAQIAMGNMWGPKQRGPGFSTAQINRNLPEEYRLQMEEQIKAQQKTMRERWLKHYAIIEDELEKMAEQNGQAQEDLYALAAGQNVHYEQARLIAIQLLGSLRTPRAYATLMTIIQHRNKKVADSAAISFYGAESKAVLYLEKFYVSNRSWLRRRVIQATRYLLYYLLTFNEQEAAVAYSLLENDIEGLFDTDDTNTFAAAVTLLGGRDRDDIEILEGYFENDRPIIKIEAMCALVHLVPQRAERYVMPSLNSPYAAVRYAALRCVDVLSLKQCSEIYQRMSGDRSQRVSELARKLQSNLEAEAKQARRM